MGLFEPTWKSRDKKKALAYIRSIKNTDMLLEIYQEARKDDRYQEAMLCAAMRLADYAHESQLHPQTLKALALYGYNMNSTRSYTGVIAAISSQDILAEIAQKATYDGVALAALQRIDDELLLADIAKNCKHPEVGKHALERITNQALIVDVMENAMNRKVFEADEKKMFDEAVLDDDQVTIDNIRLNLATEEMFLRAMDRIQDTALKEQSAQAFLEKNKEKLFDPLFETALKYINDQDYIRQIVCNENEEYDEQLRAAAVRKIINSSHLEQIILDEHEDYFVRQSALEALRHPTKLYSIVLKWLNGSHYVRLFDDALAKFSPRDFRTLSSIALDDYAWEFRVSAFRRILEFDDVSAQDKKRIFDSLKASVVSTEKKQRLIAMIPQDLRDDLGFQVI